MFIYRYFLICWCDCISQGKKSYLHLFYFLLWWLAKFWNQFKIVVKTIPFIKLLHAFKSTLICHHLLWFRFISLIYCLYISLWQWVCKSLHGLYSHFVVKSILIKCIFIVKIQSLCFTFSLGAMHTCIWILFIIFLFL